MQLSGYDKLSKVGNNVDFEDLRFNRIVNRLRIMTDYQQELPFSQQKRSDLYSSLAKMTFLARFSGVLKSSEYVAFLRVTVLPNIGF